MNQEKGIVFLTSLIVIGVVLICLSVGLRQSWISVPIIILGLIFTVLILFTNEGNISHKIESLEKIFFVITFLIIVISFILLYKPIMGG